MGAHHGPIDLLRKIEHLDCWNLREAGVSGRWTSTFPPGNRCTTPRRSPCASSRSPMVASGPHSVNAHPQVKMRKEPNYHCWSSFPGMSGPERWLPEKAT